MIKISNTKIDIFLKIVIITLIIGLFFSKAMVSISIVLLSVGFLFYENRINQIKSIAKNKLYQSSLIIILIYILSGFCGGSFTDYVQAVKGKISYLFVPITLSLMLFYQKEKICYKFIFAACALIQSFYATKIFIADSSKIIDVYHSGNVLPVIKIHHVQIAALIAISIILLVSVLFSATKKWLKIIATIIAVWLFIFLHLFAVRTGLILVYGMLVLYFSSKLIEQKKWYILSGTLIIIITFGGIILNYSQTIQNKISYMKYDLQKFKTNANDLMVYSDSRRLKSLQIGIQILKKYPLTGCGIGNIKQECSQLYKVQHSNSDYYYLPHSQYIYFLSSFGWIAGSILIFCFLYPLIYYIKQKNYLLTTIYSGLIVFGIWDAILGTLFGNSVYMLMIGFGINKNEKSTTYK